MFKKIDKENSTDYTTIYHPNLLFDRYGELKDSIFAALFILIILVVIGIIVGFFAYVSKTSCGQKAEFTGLESTWTWQSGCIYKDEGQIVRIN